MEVKYKRADAIVWGDVIIRDGIKDFVHSIEFVCGYVRINNDEALTFPEARILLDSPAPSDLEIVQKALDKTGSRLSIGTGGGWIAEKNIDTVTGSGYDTQSLLTWAKQTIGHE